MWGASKTWRQAHRGYERGAQRDDGRLCLTRLRAVLETVAEPLSRRRSSEWIMLSGLRFQPIKRRLARGERGTPVGDLPLTKSFVTPLVLGAGLIEGSRDPREARHEVTPLNKTAAMSGEEHSLSDLLVNAEERRCHRPFQGTRVLSPGEPRRFTPPSTRRLSTGVLADRRDPVWPMRPPPGRPPGRRR